MYRNDIVNNNMLILNDYSIICRIPRENENMVTRKATPKYAAFIQLKKLIEKAKNFAFSGKAPAEGTLRNVARALALLGQIRL